MLKGLQKSKEKDLEAKRNPKGKNDHTILKKEQIVKIRSALYVF